MVWRLLGSFGRLRRGKMGTGLSSVGPGRLKRKESPVFHLPLGEVAFDPNSGRKGQEGGHAYNSARAGKTSM